MNKCKNLKIAVPQTIETSLSSSGIRGILRSADDYENPFAPETLTRIA